MRYERDSAKLKQLRVGEECYLNMLEEGGARVERHEDRYDVYEVLLYGTGEFFEQSFQIGDEDSLLTLIYSWT